MRWLLVILFISSVLEAQVKTQHVAGHSDSISNNTSVKPAAEYSPIEEIFKKVEFGLQSNSVDSFKDEFGEIVSMTISSGEHGYYSANQAVSVLVNFFSERRLSSFKFSRITKKGDMPYATGRFFCIQKGIQNSAQVYVSLTRQDSLWVISQFNIY